MEKLATEGLLVLHTKLEDADLVNDDEYCVTLTGIEKQCLMIMTEGLIVAGVKKCSLKKDPFFYFGPKNK